ncbi:MAG: heme lyase NrfEFG subunit NrfE, partial [Altererythrobacter sp.]|nr:heme lyase NrfEFG subunit NrfE [Altererythrobacter sp.]
ALVFNNVMLSAILGIVLLGTLYPLLTEAFDVRVSVGPPYFNPVGAIFTIPMLAVMAVGPLLRWREDNIDRIKLPIAIVTVLTVTAALLFVVFATGIGILPLLGLAFAVCLGAASFMPLRGRNLLRVPLATWGMVVAHFGIAVALLGMACESAFTNEKLVAVAPGETTELSGFAITLESVDPIAGPNWTAMEARITAQRGDGPPALLNPQSRHFWAPVQQTTESALLTRWDGQLYAVVGAPSPDGRWQLRLWWKPLVTLIWYGGLLIALGGTLSIIGRLSTDIRRRRQEAREAEEREDMALLHGSDNAKPAGEAA